MGYKSENIIMTVEEVLNVLTFVIQSCIISCVKSDIFIKWKWFGKD